MIVIERILKAPDEEVWKAISVRDEMKHWYYDILAFKPEIGFIFLFTGQGKILVM